MKFLDLFSGIGGFRLGLERAGHTAIGYCEIDEKARKSYQAIFNPKNEWTAKDITKVTDKEWRDLNQIYGTIDLISGGFPCQAFSLSGRRKGFDDARGTLFFDLMRAAQQIKPRLLFFENVSGLLSHEDGRTFATILSIMDECGYDVEWRVLNSKTYGYVPQNRERIYIIGHSRKESFYKIFPLREIPQTIFRKQHYSNVTNVVGVTRERNAPRFGNTQAVYSDKGIIGTLMASDDGNAKQILEEIHSFEEDDVFIKIPNQIETLSFPQQLSLFEDIKKSRTSYLVTKIAMIEDQALPIISKGDISFADSRFFRLRRLTAKEYWRLQSFPDWAYERAAAVNLESALYKQAGNSVTVNVIYEIAKKLY
ncbi:DNA cytosine methyltransferase [Listeria monocytogenes]|uniref:Cytosine-specific methyltransferase n=1 Tax=Listeria monocytogenes TaxID=1639 RepID=A0AAN3BCI5_LISMN|nr:DNA cytosine methyltransferase [Listeria monocytogenes]EAC3367766.1 DNA cytosine methyltransferase [Listeria monocytogenes]EAC7084994.1 DNA cytosine methyltransferase [Listeria monocytogenes]EAC8542021.1 DNA cytosine methyltransferase [Listeria monocytogenes]EAC8548022.1 DNA cytosine methyltransferase [Listeria monocytogenes]